MTNEQLTTYRFTLLEMVNCCMELMLETDADNID